MHKLLLAVSMLILVVTISACGNETTVSTENIPPNAVYSDVLNKSFRIGESLASVEKVLGE